VPNLLALMVCERVILDRQDMPSLINVFQKMNIQLSGAPLPEKAVSPTRWSVFTLWQHEDSETGKTFTQTLEIVLPNGEVFSATEQEFKSEKADDIQNKIAVEFTGIPIWQEGFLQVRVSLKNSDQPPSVYKFAVKYLPKEESNAKSSDA
jgi:hypothetical protein